MKGVGVDWMRWKAPNDSEAAEEEVSGGDGLHVVAQQRDMRLHVVKERRVST